MSVLDLRSLLEALVRHDVRFVIVGGVAVAAHGYVRATDDADLVPDPDRANLRRLRTALRELEAALPFAEGRPFDPARDAARMERGENLTLSTRFGELDVIQRAPGGATYEALDEDAVEAELLGVPVRVCSLAKLREMKRAAGRSQDLADLENLPDA